MVDQYGIPVLRFHFEWTEHEIKQVQHMHQTFTDIIEAMGGTVMGLRNPERESAAFPSAARSFTRSGTVRMGNDPQDVGAEQILPGARSEKSVRGRCGAVRQQPRQESDADDHARSHGVPPNIWPKK